MKTLPPEIRNTIDFIATAFEPTGVRELLTAAAEKIEDPKQRLRAMWALHMLSPFAPDARQDVTPQEALRGVALVIGPEGEEKLAQERAARAATAAATPSTVICIFGQIPDWATNITANAS